MSKYAFGLWQYGINPKGVHSNELVVRPAGEFPHGTWIADCGVKTDPKAVANARLISAAPDMLYALEEIVALVDMQCDPRTAAGGYAMVRAKAAIKKANKESA